MRLLFFDFTLPYLLRDSEYPVGGWAVQLNEWLTGLSRIGEQAGVLTWKGANDYVGPQTKCDLIEAYDPSRGIRILKYFYSYIPSMLAAARDWRPDIVLQSASGVHTGILAYVAGRLGVPFVHRIASDIDVDERRDAKLLLSERIAFRYGLRRADLIICQNAYQFGRLRRAYPDKRLLQLDQVIHVPSALPAPRPRAQRAYVAWLGVFREPKNMPLLCRVARELPDIEFRVAGMRPEKIDAESAAAVDALKILPNVKLVGYVRRSDVFDFLAGAAALLCTSRYEGFSNTFLEALWTGTPIVTRSGVDPNSFIAQNGVGRVAPDDEHLSESVREMCGLNGAEYATLAQRCRAYVENQHNPTVVMRGLMRALHTLIDPGTG